MMYWKRKSVNIEYSRPTAAIAAVHVTSGLLAFAGLTSAALPVEAKTPGATYCYRNVCHRVKTIPETTAETGKPVSIAASYYDDPARDRMNPSLITSSGRIFRPLACDNAASPVYPDGTTLLIYAPETGAAAAVRIDNAGPYHGERLLDVSPAVAEKLGFLHQGTARVIAVVLTAPSAAESRYEPGKVYTPVPGYLGRFTGLAAALAEGRRRLKNPPQTPAATILASAPVQPLPQAPSLMVLPVSAAAPLPLRALPPPSSSLPAAHALELEETERASGKPRRRGVVLLPVKLRRPHLLALRQKKGEKTADGSTR